MFSFILRRVLLMVPTTLAVAMVLFGLYQAAPGDPATVMMGMGGGGEMGQNADYEAKIAKFRTKHGLDRHWAVQFLNYIGPFNLLRDGHPFFTSPYGERELRTVTLPDGSEVVEGEPEPIGPLPGLDDAVLAKIESAAETIADDEAGEARWSAATAALVAESERAAAPIAEDPCLPPLLSELYDLRLAADSRGPAILRVSDALADVSGYDPRVPPEGEGAEGKLALLRHWFGWYYENGADRVRNSGKKPWGGLLTFDLGNEMQRKTPVADEIVRRLKVTVPLSLVSVFLIYLISLPLGIFSVQQQGTKMDAFTTIVLFVLYSIPTFWAGLMLILLFGVTGPEWFLAATISGGIAVTLVLFGSFSLRGKPLLGTVTARVAALALGAVVLFLAYTKFFGWTSLPVIGLTDKDHEQFSRGAQVWDVLKHCVLPVVTLTYGGFAYLSRQMRAGMLEVIRQDFIRTARAKGLSEQVVVYKHALRNALIPVVTIFASILPILIGGSIIVESVFDIPGMGKYAFEGLLRRDFYVIMATTLFVGIMTQIGILLSDITYSIVDPRIRHD